MYVYDECVMDTLCRGEGNREEGCGEREGGKERGMLGWREERR